jgi:hypothetical protein
VIPAACGFRVGSNARDVGKRDFEAALERPELVRAPDVQRQLAFRYRQTAVSGAQTILLIFDKPQRLTRISLVFEETETERIQEFVLRWSGDDAPAVEF